MGLNIIPSHPISRPNQHDVQEPAVGPTTTRNSTPPTHVRHPTSELQGKRDPPLPHDRLTLCISLPPPNPQGRAGGGKRNSVTVTVTVCTLIQARGIAVHLPCRPLPPVNPLAPPPTHRS